MKKYNYSINLIGLRCPEPLIKIRTKIRYMKSGEKLLIISDDQTVEFDIINFCCFMKYDIIYKKKKKYYQSYIIKK